MLKPTRSYRGPLLNARKSYLLVRKWVYPIHQLHFIIPAGFENTELLYSTNGHSESRCCVWFTAFRTLVCVHICKTMFISDYKSPLTSEPRASKVITFIWPNHLSMIQRGNTHNLFMLSSVMMAIEMKQPYVWVSSLWIPHGDGARRGRI